MRYAIFETASDDHITPQQIGAQIEAELEKLKYHILLPTAADWGYVFSIKTGGRRYNVAWKSSLQS